MSLPHPAEADLAPSRPRYAIYYVPAAGSALYQFGASALGYDCYTGEAVSLPQGGPFSAPEWKRLTDAPRIYGFHATLKAPFFLNSSRSEEELTREFLTFAHSRAALPLLGTTLTMLDHFATIVPEMVADALNAFAADCVRSFDAFRAPLTPHERDKRPPHTLTIQQRSNFERWGYPYVFEDFRFHMTLTGRLEGIESAPALQFLHRKFMQRRVPRSLQINSVTLLRQDSPTAGFRVIGQSELGEA